MVIGLIPPLKFEILNAFARGQYTYARVSNFVIYCSNNFNNNFRGVKWRDCFYLLKYGKLNNTSFNVFQILSCRC